jgi:hypothetical protein
MLATAQCFDAAGVLSILDDVGCDVYDELLMRRLSWFSKLRISIKNRDRLILPL